MFLAKVYVNFRLQLYHTHLSVPDLHLHKVYETRLVGVLRGGLNYVCLCVCVISSSDTVVKAARRLDHGNIR